MKKEVWIFITALAGAVLALPVTEQEEAGPASTESIPRHGEGPPSLYYGIIPREGLELESRSHEFEGTNLSCRHLSISACFTLLYSFVLHNRFHVES